MFSRKSVFMPVHERKKRDPACRAAGASHQRSVCVGKIPVAGQEHLLSKQICMNIYCCLGHALQELIVDSASATDRVFGNRTGNRILFTGPVITLSRLRIIRTSYLSKVFVVVDRLKLVGFVVRAPLNLDHRQAPARCRGALPGAASRLAYLHERQSKPSQFHILFDVLLSSHNSSSVAMSGDPLDYGTSCFSDRAATPCCHRKHIARIMGQTLYVHALKCCSTGVLFCAGGRGQCPPLIRPLETGRGTARCDQERCLCRRAMSRRDGPPMCAICMMCAASQQIDVSGTAMVLVCGNCAGACRQATTAGCTLEDMQVASQEGRLQQFELLGAPHTTVAPPIDAAPPRVLLPNCMNMTAPGNDSSGLTVPTSDTCNGSDNSAGAAADGTATGTRLDTLVRTALAFAEDDKSGDICAAAAAAGVVPAGRKMCNLCREVLDISRFPVAGERLKPYCCNCMPSVRKGSLMGIRVAELRDALQVGGVQALHDLLHS